MEAPPKRCRSRTCRTHSSSSARRCSRNSGVCPPSSRLGGHAGQSGIFRRSCAGGGRGVTGRGVGAVKQRAPHGAAHPRAVHARAESDGITHLVAQLPKLRKTAVHCPRKRAQANLDDEDLRGRGGWEGPRVVRVSAPRAPPAAACAQGRTMKSFPRSSRATRYPAMSIKTPCACGVAITHCFTSPPQ